MRTFRAQLRAIRVVGVIEQPAELRKFCVHATNVDEPRETISFLCNAEDYTVTVGMVIEVLVNNQSGRYKVTRVVEETSSPF